MTRTKRTGLVITTFGLVVLLGGLVTCVSSCSKSAPPPAKVSDQEASEFRNAIYDGDAAIVDRLLTAKPGLVNVRDENGKTPLAIAKERGDDDVVQVLLRHGAKE